MKAGQESSTRSRLATEAGSQAPWWLVAVGVVAAAKVALGALGLLLAADPGSPNAAIPPAVFGLVLVVFAVAGGVLVGGGGKDRRAQVLGVVFLLVASIFADRSLNALALGHPTLGAGARLLSHTRIDAFAPFLVWVFVRDFPRASLFGTAARIPGLGVWVAGVVGVALFVVNAALPIALPAQVLSESSHGLLGSLSRYGSGTLYWALFSGLQILAFAFALGKTRRARVEERRRVRLLLAGLLVAVSPYLIVVLLRLLVPWFGTWSRAPESIRALGWLIYPSLLFAPAVTAYAVGVEHALDVRLVVRKAVQYGIARGTALVAISLPALVFAAILYRGRDDSLAQVFLGRGAPWALAAAVGSWIAFRFRKPLLTAVDRQFFREQYDARQILSAVAERSRRARDPVELGALLEGEIDRALHLEVVRFLRISPTTNFLVGATGGIRSLSASSAIAGKLQGQVQPQAVRWTDPSSWIHQLPESERFWLADSQAEMLAGLHNQAGDLIGVITLGDKRSELPFTAEDRGLIGAISASASVALDRWLLSTSTPPADEEPHLPGRAAANAARECPDCATVFDPMRRTCPDCKTTTIPGGLPQVLAGRYRIERRLGAGGMGLVYQAVDGTLQREVAIKTLPPLSPRYARHLRREARAVAAVSHPNLAPIYDYQSWNGVPVLVLEYLEGGTIADRLPHAPLPVTEAIDMGIALAGALGRMHDDGMMHRDVKPSNIGFTRRGQPKLMDFGLAGSFGLVDKGKVAEGEAGGTVPYMSPEALEGHPPEPGFDLWGLAVTLFESLTGRNPFASATAVQTLVRMMIDPLPDIRDDIPGCPDSLGDFFRTAFAREGRERPVNAADFERRLRIVRAEPVYA